MKYVFIEKHQAEFSIKAMCRVLQVARSGWYVWHQRRHQINRRQQFRLVCDNVVREAFSDAKQRYGAPRLTDELRAQGRVYNIKNRGGQPASAGTAGESLAPVPSGQLPRTWSASLRESAEAGLLRQRPESEVGG